VESFRFDPNTVSKEDLRRLGFSEKQAQSIINYREKGGRFRRKSDFAKSFVVSDSIYKRLEPYIRIPKTDLNQADSAAFDALPGIGGWFASKMVAYRRELGGYSSKEQLMEIYRFDREKFDALKDLVVIRQPYRYPLWQLPADSLRRHPYIKNYETARAIVLFRDNNPPEKWTVAALAEAGVFTMEQAMKFSRCVSTGSQN
jgi:DNA uptake protein ComE-like DNA-binding protein